MSTICSLAQIFVITTFLSCHIFHHVQGLPRFGILFRADTDLTIRAKSCTTRAGSGVCTYVWSCWFSGGTHIGLCRDRFFIGSCCLLPTKNVTAPLVKKEEMLESSSVSGLFSEATIGSQNILIDQSQAAIPTLALLESALNSETTLKVKTTASEVIETTLNPAGAQNKESAGLVTILNPQHGLIEETSLRTDPVKPTHYTNILVNETQTFSDTTLSSNSVTTTVAGLKSSTGAPSGETTILSMSIRASTTQTPETSNAGSENLSNWDVFLGVSSLHVGNNLTSGNKNGPPVLASPVSDFTAEPASNWDVFLGVSSLPIKHNLTSGNKNGPPGITLGSANETSANHMTENIPGPIIETPASPVSDSTAEPALNWDVFLGVSSLPIEHNLTSGNKNGPPRITLSSSNETSANHMTEKITGPIIVTTASPVRDSTADPALNWDVFLGVSSLPIEHNSTSGNKNGPPRIKLNSTNETSANHTTEKITGPIIETPASPVSDSTAKPASDWDVFRGVSSLPKEHNLTSGNKNGPPGITLSSTNETSANMPENITGPIIETSASPGSETTAKPNIETTASQIAEVTAGPVIETGANLVNKTTNESVNETTAVLVSESTAMSVFGAAASSPGETTVRSIIETTIGQVSETTASQTKAISTETQKVIDSDPLTLNIHVDTNSEILSNDITENTVFGGSSTKAPALSIVGTMSIHDIPGLVGAPELFETMMPDINNEIDQTTVFGEDVTTLPPLPHNPIKCSNDPVCMWQQLLGTEIPGDNSTDIPGDNSTNYVRPTPPSTTTFSVPTLKLTTETPKEQILSPEDKRIILMLNMKKTSEVCGRPTISQGRIVNGNKATFAQYPWHIALYGRRPLNTGDPKLKCGAVLLDHNWVITAAHCLEGLRAGDIYLRLGEFDLESETEAFSHEDRQVAQVIIHPKFKSSTFENDIALLRMMQPVIYQPNIIPICIPDGDSTYAGRLGTVTGWGRLSDGGPLPNVLQHVELPILSNTECETMYKRAGSPQDIPESKFICAGFSDGKRDACEGDSGGPMVLLEGDRNILIGVVSWGIDCAAPNQPGAYTRITKYKDWIDKTVLRARNIALKKANRRG